jgi:hypothetical protein
VDDTAERMVQLGGVAEGTARLVAKRSSLAEYPANTADDRSHVEALSSPWWRSARRHEKLSGRPTNWETWTRLTCSRQCRAASTYGCGSSRRTCKPSDDQSRHTGDGHGPCRQPGPAVASATMPANRTCEVYIRR